MKIALLLQRHRCRLKKFYVKIFTNIWVPDGINSGTKTGFGSSDIYKDMSKSLDCKQCKYKSFILLIQIEFYKNLV